MNLFHQIKLKTASFLLEQVMSALLKSITSLPNFIWNSFSSPAVMHQQVRTEMAFADWRMLKDYKKRKCVKEFAKERLRINSLRKNDILPHELVEVADQEIAALPTNSSITRVVFRCSLTSRPRGCVKKWRVSRIVWRHLADYNKLSGVQRAMW